MDAHECAALIAAPIGELGARFYFDEATRSRAKELGLRSVEYYGLGRAGVMGDVSAEEVEDAFAFFSPTAVQAMYTNARERVSPLEAAVSYLASADSYAERTFATLSSDVLASVARAADEVAAVVPVGRYRVFDGYVAAPAATSEAAKAYRGVIILRELRGGAHAVAVADAGLAPADAAYVESPDLFRLHGFVEGDRRDPDAAPARRALAEEATTHIMSSYVEALSASARVALVEGVIAMAACGGGA
jgi:Helix-turn-helix family